MGWAFYAFTRGVLLMARWRVWHGLATVVDSVRESIHVLRCDFLCLQDTRGRGKPVLICIRQCFML